MVPFDATQLQHHRDCLARLGTGDVEALRELHQELGGLVHGIVRRVLSDPEDVREIVQDTFVKIWRQAKQYRSDRGEVFAWVVFMARNLAIDRRRRGTRRQAIFTVLENDTPAGVETPTRDGFDRREFLDRHLSALSRDQRQALELAFFSGYSQLEIASAMHTPVGNVKNHLRRGLLKLRQLVIRHD